MSYVYRQDLNWLISDFTSRVADVAHAAVVSADGVPLALSEGIPEFFAEQLAAITSGLASLMQGAARIFEAGTPTQALVEMVGGLMIIKSISDGSSLCVLASPECDTELVSYEPGHLVGDQLGVALGGGGGRGPVAGPARWPEEVLGLQPVDRYVLYLSVLQDGQDRDLAGSHRREGGSRDECPAGVGDEHVGA